MSEHGEMLVFCSYSEEEERFIMESAFLDYHGCQARILAAQATITLTMRHCPLHFSQWQPDTLLLSRIMDFFPHISVSEKVSADAQQQQRRCATEIELLLRDSGCEDDIDCFSVGSQSRGVGDFLCRLHGNRGSGTAWSVILLDRTYDMLSPLAASDNFIDKLFNTLPRISNLSDVQVWLQAHIHSYWQRLFAHRYP